MKDRNVKTGHGKGKKSVGRGGQMKNANRVNMMYFLYKYKYGTFRHVELTVRRVLG
jgi:hypothetical protein